MFKLNVYKHKKLEKKQELTLKCRFGFSFVFFLILIKNSTARAQGKTPNRILQLLQCWKGDNSPGKLKIQS